MSMGVVRLVKIARITTQKRKKNRYNIFTDDGNGEEYGFSVDEDILIKYHLRKGMELEDAMIIELKKLDTIEKSYSKAIHYLGYRMRTEKEMRDYLKKQEVDHEHISIIINRLFDRDLLNDVEFANMFVRTRINTTSKGPTLVRQELTVKGVSSHIASEAIVAYTYEVQYEKALQTAKKRMNRTNRNSLRKQIQQLQAYLMRNGFSGDVIRDVVAEVQETMDTDSERDAVLHQGERLFRRHERKLQGRELLNKLKQGLYQQGFNKAAIEQFIDEKEQELFKEF